MGREYARGGQLNYLELKLILLTQGVKTPWQKPAKIMRGGGSLFRALGTGFDSTLYSKVYKTFDIKRFWWGVF